MLGILKTILGSGDVISKGMDLLDDMHTSKEEEIEAKNKAKVNLLGAYAPFKIAQRFLAMVFSTTFLLAFFLVLGMTLAGKGNTEDVMEVVRARKSRRLTAVMDTPEDELFTIKRGKMKLPDEARIYPSVKCGACGEKVMEPRARLRDGVTLCLPCFGAFKSPDDGQCG